MLLFIWPLHSIVEDIKNISAIKQTKDNAQPNGTSAPAWIYFKFLQHKVVFVFNEFRSFSFDWTEHKDVTDVLVNCFAYIETFDLTINCL